MWSYNLIDCGRLQEFLDHQVLILCELDMPMVLTLLLWLSGRLDPFNWFYHASGAVVVTPNERPKSSAIVV